MTQDELKIIFRNNIFNILKNRNMSMYRLSKLSGISQSRISDYVNGKVTPTVFCVINIAHALDITVDELVGYDILK
jgi:transcriptional regulator with XRE-family HTH domain